MAEALFEDIERHLPRYRLELRAAPLRTGLSHQRLGQARRRVLFHDPRRALRADHALIERVIRVAVDIADFAVAQMHADAAAARAHVAGRCLHIQLFVLRARVVFHLTSLPLPCYQRRGKRSKRTIAISYWNHSRRRYSGGGECWFRLAFEGLPVASDEPWRAGHLQTGVPLWRRNLRGVEHPVQPLEGFQRASGYADSPVQCNAGLPGVDTDHARSGVLAELPNRRYRLARSQLYDHNAVDRREPCIEPRLLLFCAQRNPVVVAEHQDVGARKGAAVRADRYVIDQLAGRCVDHGLKRFRRPHGVGADLRALENVNGPMAFGDPLIRKSGLLKLTVDVTGEHRCAVPHALRPTARSEERRVGKEC